MNKTTNEPRLCVTCAFNERPEAKAVCRACIIRSSGKRTNPMLPEYAPNWRKAGSKTRMYMPGLQLRAPDALAAIIAKKPVFCGHKFQLYTWMEQMRLSSIIHAANVGIIFEAIKSRNKRRNI